MRIGIIGSMSVGLSSPKACTRRCRLAPVCRRLIRVNTPGVTCADIRQLHYAHRRRPLFPFEEIEPG
jgi:microcystin degradation protein MlrC